MTDRPIIFSAPMVRALLDGRKSMTRRVLNPQPIENATFQGIARDGRALFSSGCFFGKARLPYAPGDRLYVREGVRGEELPDGQDGVRYRADYAFIPIEGINAPARWLKLHTYADHSGHPVGPWVPSIHMPRWASRLALTVTDVRVQRLQDISEEDAIAEGCDPVHFAPGGSTGNPSDGWLSYSEGFRTLWNSLHGADAWDQNPWVCALTFTVQRGNIDQIGRTA